MFFLKVEDEQGNFVENIDKILSVTIKQQEGFLPYAQLSIPKTYNLEKLLRHECVYEIIEKTSNEYRLLFRGSYVGQTPQGLHAIALVFLPKMLSISHIRELFAPYLQEHDSLFEHTEHSGFNYPIETVSVILDYDRAQQQYGINNVFEGRRGLVLKNLPQDEVFHLDITKIPYGKIHLKFEMNWSRSSFELFDLGGLIQQGAGPIHTLTPQSMQEAWPKVGQPLCRGVFTVISSNLPITKREDTSVLKMASDVGEEEKVPVSIATVKPELIVSHEKKFHYYEIFETDVTLSSASSFGAVMPQHFRLNAADVGEVSEDRAFFESDRGKMAIRHAMKVAQMKLWASHRNHRLTLTVPYDESYLVSTFDWVLVEDPRLPKGTFEGKVIDYTIYIQGYARNITITLAACSSYGADLLQKKNEISDAWGDLSVQLKEEVKPKNGMQDIVANVAVDHGAMAQIQGMEQSGDLNVNATIVKVHLNPQALVKNQTIRKHFALSSS
ncbi:MAG: hypothetical protein J0G29_05050 [Alphaproteobacteria bacterium]|nr:hypothetical protein [Alphaproteobacteria bacterium]OJV47953.1 MAG: hypothetical protein BGO28_03750 [Alphaproteobacteria bacterium 43-37]